MLGALARFIPPEEYAKAVKAIDALATEARMLQARLASIEAHVAKGRELEERIVLLESAARSDSPSFAMMQAEQSMWMVPGSIERALAPSEGDKADG
jgi:hypothetical protein